MRKTRPDTTRHDPVEREHATRRRIPQPARRRLALEAENAKVNAQIGLRISWIH
jgi:hypothetical protein